jgi:hypothetical protein
MRELDPLPVDHLACPTSGAAHDGPRQPNDKTVWVLPTPGPAGRVP